MNKAFGAQKPRTFHIRLLPLRGHTRAVLSRAETLRSRQIEREKLPARPIVVFFLAKMRRSSIVGTNLSIGKFCLRLIT